LEKESQAEHKAYFMLHKLQVYCI